MTTVRPSKTSYENQQLRSCDYFVIIPTTLNFTVLVKPEYVTTGLQGAPFKQIERIKELLFYADVVAETANVVISLCCFAQDCKELF